MKFGGLQKLSMIDFPGHIAAVVFAPRCNYACPYCHNPSLLALKDSEGISAEEVLEFLSRRTGLLDGVAVTGGEPTLSADLADFLHRVKGMGFAVKLDTNGSNPEVLRDLLEKRLLDYIAMDLKTLPERYSELVGAPFGIEPRLKESIGIVMGSGLPYEFRTTCVRSFLSEEVVERLGRMIEGASLWSFQQCNPENVLKPEFFEDSPRLFSGEELARMESIAARYVTKTLVR